jgi:uncharacterized protein YkwD
MRAAALLSLVAGCLLATLSITPASATAKPRLDAREKAIIRAINRRRADHDLPKVRSTRPLSRAADYHSWEMLDADYFAHESRDGGPFDERVRRFADHRALGETLAMVGRCGSGSPRRIVRMWMDSPGHRAILLDGTYRRIGVGKRTGRLGDDRVCVVTADFGSRR